MQPQDRAGSGESFTVAPKAQCSLWKKILEIQPIASFCRKRPEVEEKKAKEGSLIEQKENSWLRMPDLRLSLPGKKLSMRAVAISSSASSSKSNPLNTDHGAAKRLDQASSLYSQVSSLNSSNMSLVPKCRMCHLKHFLHKVDKSLWAIKRSPEREWIVFGKLAELTRQLREGMMTWGVWRCDFVQYASSTPRPPLLPDKIVEMYSEHSDTSTLLILGRVELTLNCWCERWLGTIR